MAKIANGRSLLPNWLVIGLLGTIVAVIWVVGVVIGAVVWGISFLIDIRGHYQWYRSYRYERSLRKRRTEPDR